MSLILLVLSGGNDEIFQNQDKWNKDNHGVMGACLGKGDNILFKLFTNIKLELFSDILELYQALN